MMQRREAAVQVFIAMAKALDFIDPDKLSMTVPSRSVSGVGFICHDLCEMLTENTCICMRR